MNGATVPSHGSSCFTNNIFRAGVIMSALLKNSPKSNSKFGGVDEAMASRSAALPPGLPPVPWRCLDTQPEPLDTLLTGHVGDASSKASGAGAGAPSSLTVVVDVRGDRRPVSCGRGDATVAWLVTTAVQQLALDHKMPASNFSCSYGVCVCGTFCVCSSGR